MKKHFFILLMIWGSISNTIYAQTGNNVYDSISHLNLDHYASLPVDSFLRVIPQTYNEIGIYGDLGPNDKAIGLTIRYQNGVLLSIKPKNYLFMNRVGHNNWDLSLFKKETASYIMVLPPESEAIYGIYP